MVFRQKIWPLSNGFLRLPMLATDSVVLSTRSLSCSRRPRHTRGRRIANPLRGVVGASLVGDRRGKEGQHQRVAERFLFGHPESAVFSRTNLRSLAGHSAPRGLRAAGRDVVLHRASRFGSAASRPPAATRAHRGEFGAAAFAAVRSAHARGCARPGWAPGRASPWPGRRGVRFVRQFRPRRGGVRGPPIAGVTREFGFRRGR
jgi:hypothetical protein